MKVLVTGVDGFVGRRLGGILLERGFSVVGSARRPGVLAPSLQLVLTGDLRSPLEWESALKGVEAVIHLAARAHVVDERSRNPIAEFREVNVRPSIALFRACQKAGVARFVFVSSIGVNGVSTKERPFSELDVPKPTEAYGQSKWEAEQGLRELRERGSTPVVIVRPALIYGPHARGNLFKLMRWVERGRLMPLGAVSASRSFLGLSNFCDLLVRCLTDVNAEDQVFLAADPEPISTVGMVRAIAQSMHRHPRLIGLPPGLLRLLGFVTRRSHEVDRLTASLVVDSSKARTVLKWPTSSSFEYDVQAMVDEFLRTKPMS